MESHSKGLKVFKSIEDAAAQYGLPEDVFKEKVELEELLGIQIPIPEYFDSITEAIAYLGNRKAVSEYSGIPRTTLSGKLLQERDKKVKIPVRPKGNIISTTNEVREGLLKDIDDLEAKEEKKEESTKLKEAQKEILRLRAINEGLLKLPEVKPLDTSWMKKECIVSDVTGVPTLLVSDIHCGEVIDKDQMQGVNEYNTEVMLERMYNLTEKTIDLLTKHMVEPKYPGIVVCFAGDLISGDIHDDLKYTNDLSVYESIGAVLEVSAYMLNRFKEVFKNVVVFNVIGNHGRTEKKPWFKESVKNNADWFHGFLLQREFMDDPQVQVVVAESENYDFEIYNHRYSLTHGSQYTGGQGLLGATVPVVSGDAKRRANMASMGRFYDTLLMGHFHNYITLPNVICNGSVVGYSQYAKNKEYLYQEPVQALWVTHPEYGITFNMPVYLDKKVKGWDKTRKDFVSWNY